MKNKYVLRNTSCDCHPETCGHPDYEIAINDAIVCRGNNLYRMERLVDAANKNNADIDE